MSDPQNNIMSKVITVEQIHRRMEEILAVIEKSSVETDHLTALALIGVGIAGSRHFGLSPQSIQIFVDMFCEQNSDKPTCPLPSRKLEDGEKPYVGPMFIAPGTDTLN